MEMLMASQPIYNNIVSAGRASEGSIFVDVGCNSELLAQRLKLDFRAQQPETVGTDVRRLILDGYPAADVYGCDLHGGFIDLGYKLYRDKSTCPIVFFAADMFSLLQERDGLVTNEKDGLTTLRGLEGRVKHLYGGLLFHLFNEETQTQVARVFSKLISRKPGSVIFGTHIGREPAGELSTSFSK